MIQNKRRNWDWQIVIVGGFVLYLVISLAYLFLGEANADEGWYLYASKLVYEGKLAYRDFAFTQMPLLPYVYGLPQVILQPSIYLGRAISVILSIANLIFCISLGYKYAGKAGAGLVTLLLCSFIYGIYSVTIVKTYALLSLLFTVTLWLLSSNISDIWRYLLAIVFSFLALLTRLSALPFLLTIIIYSLVSVRRSRFQFISMIVTCIFLTVSASFFFYPDLEAAKWNLFTYHVGEWGTTTNIGKVLQILARRIPDLIQYFDNYAFIVSPLFVLALCDTKILTRAKNFLRRHSHILFTALGLVLFSLSHLINGSWQIEYLFPAVIAFVPIIAIAFIKIYDQQTNNSSKVILQTVMLISLLVAPLRENIQHISLSGKKLPLQEIREVSSYISRYSSPSDKVFVLEALWTAIEAHRQVLPGMTMAQFSYQDMSTEKAKELSLVNGEILLGYINNCSAKVVVLTDLDRQKFTNTGNDELIGEALAKHYNLVLTQGSFGQFSENVYVYLCHPN